MTDRMIIVDWGTTAFRAWLVDAADGTVLAEVPEGTGMRELSRSQYASYCHDRLGAWLFETPAPPIYMAGMVGAVQGWHEAPQPPLPVSRRDLAAGVVAVAEMPNAFILPGVRRAGGGRDADVIRGEEVQIFGALSIAGREDGTLCLPGTHSKWAAVEAGTLTRFTTSMTGEVFEIMLTHSILKLTTERDAPFDVTAFDAGLDQAREREGLLHHLFTARALALYGELVPEASASYVSGLLIGSEISAMAGLYPTDGNDLLLVSATHLRQPYERALKRAGIAYAWISSADATREGARAIAIAHRDSDRANQ